MEMTMSENTHARALQVTEAEEEAWKRLEDLEQRSKALKTLYSEATIASEEWTNSLSPNEIARFTLKQAYRAGYFDALCKKL
jgi:predicted DNA binding protein